MDKANCDITAGCDLMTNYCSWPPSLSLKRARTEATYPFISSQVSHRANQPQRNRGQRDGPCSSSSRFRWDYPLREPCGGGYEAATFVSQF